jgi:hypothetical protein
MWRRRTRQHSLATTGLTITSQHRWETWKSRSNRSMSLKGEKSSMVVPLHYERRLFANHRGGGDAIVIFGVKQARSVWERAHNITDIKLREILMRSQNQSRLILKYLYFVL